jgi:hypothetical protein
LTAFNGDASWTLPMPARFAIHQGGTIFQDVRSALRPTTATVGEFGKTEHEAV